MSRSHFGSVKREGEDRYRVWWTDDGKRRSKRISGTRDDAEAFLASMMLKRGEPSDMTWRSYWATAVTKTFVSLAEKTISEYERVWRVELEPRIGNRTVGSTNWRVVESTLLDISATSVQHKAFRLWRKMCNLAIRDGLLDRNPVDRSIKLKQHRKRVKTLIAAEDLPEWMESISGIKYEPLFLLEVGGGLRHEEACAMTWEKVRPFEAYGRTYAIASVESGLVTVDGAKVLKTAKNDHSVREVVIGEPFASRLLEIRKESGPVCQGAVKHDGGEYDERHFANPATVTHNWRAWCVRHDVEYVRPGDMRSVFATLHGEAGTPDSLVSLAMGHADGGSTKARNYQQRTRRGLMVAADSLSDYLAEASENRSSHHFAPNF